MVPHVIRRQICPLASAMVQMCVVLLVPLLLALGCGDDAATTKGDGGPTKDGSQQDSTPSLQLQWTKTTLDPEWAGYNASLTAGPQGTLGIAYYRQLQEEVIVTCPASGLTPGGDKPRPAHDLYFIRYDGSQWGSPVKVDQNIGEETTGLSLVYNTANNEYALGYLGGVMSEVRCTSSDAIIATSADGASWAKSTLATAGPFAGDTVGCWMSLAVDSTGALHAAHKDVRYGYYEHDGKYKASSLYDAAEVVAQEDSSGTFNSLAFTADDRPVLAFYREVGEQAIVLATKKDATWSLEELYTGSTKERISLGTDKKGRFGLAYYNETKQMLYFTESPADLSGWQARLVDPNLTNNGFYTSVAYDGQGNPGISYYQCGPYQGGGKDACHFGKDALMFAYRQHDKWQVFTVDTGNENRCGTYTSLVFHGNDPIIAYQCVGLTADKEFVDNLKLARGKYK